MHLISRAASREATWHEVKKVYSQYKDRPNQRVLTHSASHEGIGKQPTRAILHHDTTYLEEIKVRMMKRRNG